MKFSELKVGMKITDRWYFDWGTGRVGMILKTRVLVTFPDKNEVYDKAHVKFLIKGGY